ncbi:S-layer homology domain-containing protein [Paenibacillus sp. FSL E2-0178]|uniref:S-layer homology domain-containing protein n=1 Tax=Paenibacillus sp. FSL E2-0178 TaxID=2921361 RepID=UPI003159394D
MGSLFKRKAKRMISGVMAFMLVASLFGTVVHAGTNSQVSIIVSADKQSYSPGDEVTVTVSVKNIGGVTAAGLSKVFIALDYDPRFLSADDYVTEQDGMRIFKEEAYSPGGTLDKSAYNYSAPTDLSYEAGNYVPEGYNEVQFSVDALIEPAALYSDTELLSFKLKALDNAPDDADHLIKLNPQITYLQEYGVGHLDPSEVALHPAEVVLATNPGPTGPTQPTDPSGPGTPAATLTDFRLDTYTTNITVGDVIKVTGTAYYSDDSTVEITKDVEWSSNSGKAYMNNGWLTAWESGSYQITGSYEGFTDSLTFVIAQPQGEVNIEHDLLLNASYLIFKIGDYKDILAYKRYMNDKIDPLDLSEIEWSSSDASVASFGEDGRITAHAAGIATITASYHGYQRMVTVEVSGESNTTPSKTESGIVLSSTELTVGENVDRHVTASRTFSDDTQEELAASAVTWSSSDESVAKVQDGQITGISKGVATITAQYNGYEAETEVIVYVLDLGMKDYKVRGTSDLNIVKVGETDAFTATAEYYDGPSKNVTNDSVWISSNPDIFTVNNGVVTGVAPGSAKLTAVYSSVKFEQWVSVEVKDTTGGGTEPGTGTPTDPGAGSGGGSTNPGVPSKTEVGISLIPNDNLLLAPAGKQPIAVYQKFSNDSEESLSGEDVQWSSSDESVATVDDQGFVTGIAKGVSVITARHNNFEAKINAIVYTPDTGIMAFGIAGESASNVVKVGGTYAFTATVKYAGNSQKDATQDAVWVSSNPAVYTVKDGIVTGISPGMAQMFIFYAGAKYSQWVMVEAGDPTGGDTPGGGTPGGETPGGGTPEVETPGESTTGGNTSGGNYSSGNTTTNTGTSTNTTTGTIITGSIADTSMPVQPSTPSVTEVFNTKVVSPQAVVSKVQTLVSSATPAASFQQPADVKGHWAAKTIDMLLKLNIIKGYTDGTVKPNQAITRAEFVGILSRIFDVEGTSAVSFKDVTGSSWAKTAIEQFAAAGIINGYANGEFRPHQTITREEMVIVLSRVINLESLETDAAKGGFSDIQGAKAASAIEQAAQAGIISGFSGGTFAPDGNATRAEALTMILNALNLNGQIKTMLDTLK